MIDNALIVLYAASVGCAYGAMLVAYFLIHSTTLSVKAKPRPFVDALIVSIRFVVFLGVSVSLLLARPLLDLRPDPAPNEIVHMNEPIFSIVGFVLVMWFGTKVIIPWLKDSASAQISRRPSPDK